MSKDIYPRIGLTINKIEQDIIYKRESCIDFLSELIRKQELDPTINLDNAKVIRWAIEEKIIENKGPELNFYGWGDILPDLIENIPQYEDGRCAFHPNVHLGEELLLNEKQASNDIKSKIRNICSYAWVNKYCRSKEKINNTISKLKNLIKEIPEGYINYNCKLYNYMYFLYESEKPHLIFDIDHTLLFCSKLSGNLEENIIIRPHLYEVLEKLSEKYILHIWTAGTKYYAELVTKMIERNSSLRSSENSHLIKFDKVWNVEKCDYHGWDRRKNIYKFSMENRIPLQRIWQIDDYSNQIDHPTGLLVKYWAGSYEEEKDYFLQFGNFLYQCADNPDFGEIERGKYTP